MRCPSLDVIGTLLFSFREEGDFVDLVCTCACKVCRRKLVAKAFQPGLLLEKGTGGAVEVLDNRIEALLGPRVSEDDAWGLVATCIEKGGAILRVKRAYDA